ncbi:MAG: glutamine-hydrolyzing carbamoyl-phosphate synthase small subunit [Chloroflexota bacterium]|nr:glutamine-hydrolyzing carbamoyl-phosphate synthase small subunit [Chloroflexota bacterium]
MKTASLVLEDGTIITGEPFGATADAVFELVFNTSMTGYQEIITDPSYRGQGVLFTVSHIGNVGINPEDYESDRPQVSAVVTRSLSRMVSNWRARRDLDGWLSEHGVPAISGVDTRYLTRKLRDQGTMKAALSTQGTDPEELLTRARTWPGLDGLDMVQEVTCKEAYSWKSDAAQKWQEHSAFSNQHSAFSNQHLSFHVVLYDFGAKRNILRHLAARGARVTVVPADTTADDTLSLQPDGVVLSNGPGDPEGVSYAIEATRKLIDNDIPLLGICLGHQIIGLALGGCTARLKFGHHGGNHPVKDLRTGRALITAQNHNYYVVTDSLDPEQVEITHISLNDNSLEGMCLRNKPVLSVQFHPEAAPGPHDASEVFDNFFDIL